MLLLFPVCLFAQGVKISSTPGNPDPSSMLEIDATNKGVLFPRMTTTQRNAIANPAAGLIIYNSTTACFEGYFPGGWKTIACDCNSYPSSQYTASPLSPGINVSTTFTPAVQNGSSYSWTFASGSPATSTAINPAVTWSAPGTYTVSLTITDNAGCSSTTSGTITVSSCGGNMGQTATFNVTNAVQTWTVPAGVCSVNIQCFGGQGGFNGNGQAGGLGGSASGTLAVSPGQVLYVYVGASGQNGGYNGGGLGGGAWAGGKGGGASDVRINGTTLADRIIVAGGGGGNAGYSLGYGGWMGGAGGAGGGLSGDPGTQNPGNQPYPGGGGGGTQSAGGAIGTTGNLNGYVPPTPGQLGVGGNGAGESGNSGDCGNAGGGGGGYYGGGGGGYNNCGGGGGGGGSSYTGGVTSGLTSTGVRSGNGQVVITW